MFILSEPTYPRTTYELLFLGLYGLGVLINFAALVITLANYSYRLGQTYESFSGSTAVISPDLAVLLQGCSFNKTDLSMGGMTVTPVASIDENSAPYSFQSHALVIVGAIVLMFFIFLNDVFAKGCFGANIRNFRIRGITIPVNTIAANAMLVQSIGILILIGTTSSGRTFLNEYVQTCTRQFAARNFTEFLARENNVQNVFGTDLGLIVVAVSFNLAIYVLALVAICIEAFTDAAAEFEARKYFWEEGAFGVPNKRELLHYSKWRSFALKSIENKVGVELAPVSYLEFMQDLQEALARGDHRGFDSDDDEDGINDKIPGVHDDDGEDGGRGQQQRATQPAAFNPWRVSGDNEPEELVMPEAFEDEGDYFVPEDDNTQQLPPRSVSSGSNVNPASGNININSNYNYNNLGAGNHGANFYGLSGGIAPPDDGGASMRDPFSRRAASYGVPSPNDESNVDRPFERGRRSVSSSQQQQQHQHFRHNVVPRELETEEERKERHRLRRMNETPEERAMRKERKRRVQQMAARQQQLQHEGGVGSPYGRGAQQPQQSSRHIAPPVPSP